MSSGFEYLLKQLSPRGDNLVENGIIESPCGRNENNWLATIQSIEILDQILCFVYS